MERKFKDFVMHNRLLKILSLMLLTICLCTMANAKDEEMDFKVKNVTIQEAIVKLQKQSGYSIIIESGSIDIQRKISVSLKKKTISTILENIFVGQNVKMTINNKQIMVFKPTRKDSDNKINQKTERQRPKITGVVTSASDYNPMIGVTVKNLQSGLATITDINGNYSIEATQGETLVFSYIGYNNQQYKVTAKPRQNVSMTENIKALNEVIVVGFGVQKKVNLTGAVGVIDKENINGRPVVSAAQALQGLDPSMNIGINSGKPSSGYTIDIRGVSSLNGGTPLILVDGIEMSLDKLNPNDIESVSILKDASASAVYGAKAASGVILVTTKSGSTNKAQVTYNGRYGWVSNTTPSNYITCGYDWAQIVDNFFYYSNKAVKYLKYSDEDYQMLYDRRNDKTENPERPWVISQEDGSYKYYGNFDWYGYFYKRNRAQQEHNVSIRGGSENIKYFVSGRYYNTEGIMNINNDPYTTYNIRGKLDFDITPWLHYHINGNYFHSHNRWWGSNNPELIFRNISYGGSPLFVPRNPDGSIVQTTSIVNQSASICGGANLFLTYGKNKDMEDVDEMTIKNSIDIDIFKGLKAHFSHAYLYSHDFTQSRYANAPYSDKVGTTKWETTGMFRNELAESNQTTYKHTFEAYSDYVHSWNNAHNLKVMAGMQYDTRYYHKNSFSSDGNLTEDLNDFNLTAGKTYTVTGGQSKYQTLGFFGRINYDYMDRYLIELSGRADGSSRFWSKNRWGFFPSGSIGWRASEEKFWKSVSNWWNNAKLRFSVGSLGNQQVSDYLFIENINAKNTDSSFTFNGTDKLQYATEDAPVANDLTWEKVTTYDWGVDLGFLNNKLNINADIYIRNTTDMMMPGASLPGVYGTSEPKRNAADMRTTGWELVLAWHDQFELLGSPFKYNLRGTLGDYKIKVTRYDNDTRLITDHYVGEHLGEIWGYKVDGLFQTDDEATAHSEEVDCSLLMSRINNTGTRKGLHAGDMKFLDLNGDKVLSIGKNTIDDPGDRVVIGNTLPRYSYTFGGDFSWKGLDFSILFQGVGKRDWYPGAGESNLFWGPYCRPHCTFISQQMVDQIWSETNPNGYFPFPRGYEAYSSDTYANYTLTTPNNRYLQSVAYLRLKNLTFGYNITALKKYIQNIRVYVCGENLCYWSPLKKHCKYIDPEAAVSGSSYVDYSGEVYNFSKTFSIGIDVTF